jgi:alanyl-tRNA synthetase
VKAGAKPERVLKFGKKDNFWSMGDTGPCGPCSEIHYFRGDDMSKNVPELVNGPGDDTMEIWNLVFMQYEIDEVKSKEDFRILGELPKKNIDTGMGLERVAFLMQGVDNMYEIDEIFPVIERASQLSGRAYGREHVDDVRFRVVADHVRSALMLIGDGVTPGNEGRGYVLRRIMRRAIRNMRLLGATGPVVLDLIDTVIAMMGQQYPELVSDRERI